MPTHLASRTMIVLATLVLLGCTTNKPGAGDESASTGKGRLVRPESLPPYEPSMQRDLPMITPLGDTATERAAIERLEREARGIARTTGCGSASACRVAPVGAKACGGPRDYIVYCAASTDTVALLRTLRELERVEKAYNAHSGMASSCEMRVAPTAALVGGSCREATSGAESERVP